jgi:hypothetical protein
MSIEALKNKKEELEKIFDLSTIKPTRFLKLIKDEIIILDSAYSKVEQIELIKAVFGIEINYNTYFQFFNKYCKTKSKNRSNKNVKSENKKDGSKKEVVSNEDTKSSNETNIKNDSASVSKKDTNVNEDETLSLIDSSNKNEQKDSSIKKIDKSLFKSYL